MKKIYQSNIVDLYEIAYISEKEAYDGVPTVYYEIMLHNTNITIGKIDLRLKEDKRMYYYGAIGYSIYEKYRGHHYALEACKIVKTIAKDEYHLDKLIITCNPDNIASFKTLEKLGCEYKGVEDVPISHELYWRKERKKAIFELKL